MGLGHIIVFNSQLNLLIKQQILNIKKLPDKKHCGSISFLILKCLFVNFDVDKIMVKFK